jgi:4-amino-4-deoxy-L-arabinose transferase-like glycosyltransferase
MTTIDSVQTDIRSHRVPISAAAAFFWLSAVFILFWALGTRELWTAENRWAEITRNMLLSGDYFHPKINGEPYFDKPLIGYWTIALASKVTGKLDEWAIRLPSAVAGLVALWMTIFLGKRLWSAEAGRIAGWLLLGCYGFVFWARTGQADMENLAFTMAAVAWYWARRERPGFVTSFFFYVICFIGAQTKGLGAIAVPCLAVLPDLLRDRRWKHFLTLSHAAALALGLLVYFAPFMVERMTRGSYGQSGLHLVFRENVQRFFDPFDHTEPFYIYIYHLPILFLPWAPLLVIALIAAIARGRDLLSVDYPTRWVMEASLLIFLFFTASGSRRAYYILPLVPFCALLCARFLISTNLAKPRRTAIDLQTIIALVSAVGGVVVAVAVALPLVRSRLPIPLTPGFIAGLLACSLLALVPFVLRRRHTALLEQVAGVKEELAVPLVSAAILMCGYLCFQHVNLDSLRTTKTFVRSIRVLEADPKDVAFYQVTPTAVATVVYYLGDPEPHPVLQTPQEVVQFLSVRPGVHSLLITRGAYQALAADFPPGFTAEEVAAEATQTWDGANAKSKKWLMIQSRRSTWSPAPTH